jgi:hypothetical protein
MSNWRLRMRPGNAVMRVLVCAGSRWPPVGSAGGMTTYKVNEAAVEQARRLIEEGTIDTETGWGEAAPTAAEGNKEIEREGYGGYGRWHLGIDTEASEETKDRYGFPYGDFKKVNRSALIHAKQRASQNDHEEIEKVAGELLDRLDERQD